MLLTPVAAMKGVADDSAAVAVGVKAWVHVQGQLILAVPNVDGKAVGHRSGQQRWLHLTSPVITHID